MRLSKIKLSGFKSFVDPIIFNFHTNKVRIAVKRQLSRSGQSVYFLNNVRCMRKYITELLL